MSGGASDEVERTRRVGVIDNHDELEIAAAGIKDYTDGETITHARVT